MKEFKIRASACSQIMSQPRAKKDKEAGLLSQTTKTYCETWIKEILYSRRKEFSNKYTDKGIITEDNSIDYIAEHLNYGMLLKNEKYYQNELMQGTPDIVLKDLIIDVKNSWDNFTFPLFETKINPVYYWQAQVYMALTGREKYKLIYVLSDTPEHLIIREARSYCFNNGYDELDSEIYEQFHEKMTYSDIPAYFKIKVFEIERNNDDIKLIELQVIKCRNYINELTAKLPF
uniref:Uncharacterized protein n=1 Tax=uncultured marine virus TaxID=186617 RepID=A0A0F7L4N2_9VIRU|nr:hypothetical protein P12024L_20 [uncultured marine virus]